MPNGQPTPAVVKTPGEEQTSYVSPGQEIPDFYRRPGPSAPKVDQKLDNASFINAALTLSDHIGFASFDEAVTALLMAKAMNPDFDFGILRGLSGRPAAAAEAIEKNLPVLKEAFDGSIESKVRRLVSALNAVKESFEVSDGWVFPIATLKNHAICVTSNGHLFRAHFEEENGELKITKAEKFSEEIKQESIDQKISSAATALMEGKTDRAKVSLKDLLAHSMKDSRVEFDRARYQHLLKQIKESSFWKEHVRENSAKIRAFVRGDLKEVYSSGVRPRFGKLHLEKIDDKLAEQYRPNVRKALGDLSDRFSKMHDEIKESFSRDSWLVNSLSAYDKSSGLQTANFLNYFASEFLQSLTTVSEGIKLAVVESTLPFQAHLYDTLAEEYPAYVLGYLFLKKALNDIRAGV